MAAPALLATQAQAGELAIGALRLRLRHGLGLAQPRPPDAGQIGAAIADAFKAVIDPGDASHWVVRSLRLNAVSPAGDAATIAAAFASQLREAMRKLLRGEVTDGVIRYPDRAAWLAALLWDHACGLARAHWAYARHRHLDAVPREMVPRLVFEAEPADALAAMIRLTAEGRLHGFAERIGEDGARAAWPALLRAAGARESPMLEARFARQLAAVAERFPQSPQRAALVALVEQACASPGERLPGPAAVRRQIAGATARGRRPLRPVADAPGIQPARDPLAADDDVTPLRVPASAESNAQQREKGASILDSFETIDTPHAGVLLLWRSVVEMKLERLLPVDAPPGAARLTLAAALAGPMRVQAWRDPALHWLTGYEPADDETPIAADAGMPARFIAHMLDWRAPRAVTPVLRTCGRLHMLQDRETEDWLAIGTARECTVAATRLRAHPCAPGDPSRDPMRDVAFFGVATCRAARPWALLARAAYADFARRLGGLERSSANWLASNLLTGWGRLAPGEPALLVLPHVPLDLVLRMSGIDGTTVRLDDGRSVRLCLPGAG